MKRLISILSIVIFVFAGMFFISCGGEGDGITITANGQTDKDTDKDADTDTDKDTDQDEAAVLTTITISPSTYSMEVGDEKIFSTSLKDQDGKSMTGIALTCNSSDTQVVSVDDNAVAEARGAGTATITCQATNSEGKVIKDTDTITVTEPFVAELTTITVSPQSATLIPGDTTQLTAAGKDQNGDSMPQEIGFTYSSSNTSVATVSDDGLITAVADGEATITVSSASVSNTAAITVSTPAAVLTAVTISPATASINTTETQQFTVSIKNQYDSDIQGATITWSVSNSNATVSTNGLATGAAAGAADITVSVTYDSVTLTDTASLTVTQAPAVLRSISLGPYDPDSQLNFVTTTSGAGTFYIVKGDTTTSRYKVKAEPKDQYGDDISVTCSWSITDPTIASITPDSSNSCIATVSALKDLFDAGTTTSPSTQISAYSENVYSDTLEVVAMVNPTGNWRRASDNLIIAAGIKIEEVSYLECPTNIWATGFSPFGSLCIQDNNLSLACKNDASCSYTVDGNISNNGTGVEFTEVTQYGQQTYTYTKNP